MSELKPDAWMIERHVLRAPDDGEVFMEVCLPEDLPSDFDKYTEHGLAAPLYHIPEGYALVPVEPTPAMLTAAADSRLKSVLSHDWTWAWWHAGYKAMITAAIEEAE